MISTLCCDHKCCCSSFHPLCAVNITLCTLHVHLYCAPFLHICTPNCTFYTVCTCTQSNSAALSAGGETQKQAEVHFTEVLAPLHSIISTTAQNYQHHFSPFYSGARQADWLLVKLGSKKCILRPLSLLLLSVSADSLSFAK